MRLAFDGIVDFSQVDFRNAAWSIRLAWFIRELQRREMLKFFQYDQGRHLGYMAAGLLPESWKTHHKRELHSHDELIRILFDLGDSDEQQSKLEGALRNAWAREWGDPADPETKRKIDETAEALRRRRQTEVKDDERTRRYAV